VRLYGYYSPFFPGGKISADERGKIDFPEKTRNCGIDFEGEIAYILDARSGARREIPMG